MNGWLFMKTISILLLHRKHSGQKRQFIEKLYEIITMNQNDIDMVIGDFNYNFDYRQILEPDCAALSHIIAAFEFMKLLVSQQAVYFIMFI